MHDGTEDIEVPMPARRQDYAGQTIYPLISARRVRPVDAIADSGRSRLTLDVDRWFVGNYLWKLHPAHGGASLFSSCVAGARYSITRKPTYPQRTCDALLLRPAQAVGLRASAQPTGLSVDLCTAGSGGQSHRG